MTQNHFIFRPQSFCKVWPAFHFQWCPTIYIWRKKIIWPIRKFSLLCVILKNGRRNWILNCTHVFLKEDRLYKQKKQKWYLYSKNSAGLHVRVWSIRFLDSFIWDISKIAQDLFTLFFARHFIIMFQNNWIKFGHWKIFKFFAGVPWSQIY